MRLIKQTGFLFLCGLFLFTFSKESKAQSPFLEQAFIANGGQFEFAGPPYNDRASIGVYEWTDSVFTPLDTIESESVQQIALQGNSLLLSAGDTLLNYTTSYKSLTFQSGASLDGAKNISFINDNEAFIARFDFFADDSNAVKWNFTNGGLFYYDSVYSNVGEQITYEGSTFIPHNLKTKRTFPPFGSTRDSMGFIAVYKGEQFDTLINLGVDGKGVQYSFEYGGILHFASTNTGNVIKLNPDDYSISIINIDVQTFYGAYDSLVVGQFKLGGFGIFNLNSSQFEAQSLSSKQIATAGLDTLNRLVFYTETDYLTYGRGFVVEYNGDHVDSFDLAISPEAIGFQYDTASAPQLQQDVFAVTTNQLDTLDVLANDEVYGDFGINLSRLRAKSNSETTDTLLNELIYKSVKGFLGNDTVIYTACLSRYPFFCDSAEAIIVSQAGQSVNENSKELQVYPNPSSGIINIRTDKEIKSTEVLDLNGRLIRDFGNNELLNLRDLNAGSYILRIHVGGGLEYRRIIVQ